MGQVLFKMLFLLSLILAGQNSFALQCASLFSSSSQLHAVQRNNFWSQLLSNVQDPRMTRLIGKIEAWSRQSKEPDFNLTLEQVSSRDRLATLLYVLGSTASGREVINKNIRNLDRYFDEVTGDIATSVMVRVRKMDGIGYFEVTQEGGQLRLNRSLKIGTAAVVLAHELTHAYDFLSSRSFNKLPELNQRTLVTEYNAYLAEKLVINELLQRDSFKEYQRAVRDDDLNNLYTKDFSGADFILIMKNTRGISAQQTQKFLSQQKYPNF